MSSLYNLISSNNLSGLTNSILTLPHNINNKINNINIPEEEYHYKNHNLIQPEEEENYYSRLNLKGAGKVMKKRVKHSTPNNKQIDTYTKEKLAKIAKKHGIKLSLKAVKRTKSQLFNALKRKKLI